MFGSMLNLRIKKSPLAKHENEAILSQYNRLTSSRIPMNEFVHWIQNGPTGPAWHATLETEGGEIVGHTALIPLRTACRELRTVPAKVEYLFIRQGFRSAKVCGFEKSLRPNLTILINQLLRHCAPEGWGPFFVSTRPMVGRLAQRLGFRPVEFPLWECLLVLRPWNAVRHTLNLKPPQLAALFIAGMLQGPLWLTATVVSPLRKGVQLVPVGNGMIEPETNRLSFFEDRASLEWRYLEGQYMRFVPENGTADYLIAKRGSEETYLRVCQWHGSSSRPFQSLIGTLIREAQAEKAMGIRWAVYDDGAESKKIVSQMRKMGFLCARRKRTLYVHTADLKLLSPSLWKMSDSLFSFDP